MKFEMLDKFVAQKESRASAHQELLKREQSALETVQALKAKYEQMLRESLVSGQNKDAELDALDKEVASAITAYERRNLERVSYTNIVPEEITAQNVVDSWNKDFVPQFRKKRFDAVLEKLLETKKAFANAVLDYHATIAEFNAEKSYVIGEVSEKYQYKLQSIEFAYRTDIERYFITDNDLYELENRQYPKSLKGVN
ncbi:hypothetical protein [Aneurinibacillus sp. REN35]|uniref:hypothetical protein n=1 Tax=Aneurinibacillus sp. REN35 TaxID=3237286 RepID=UPI0035282D2E